MMDCYAEQREREETQRRQEAEQNARSEAEQLERKTLTRRRIARKVDAKLDQEDAEQQTAEHMREYKTISLADLLSRPDERSWHVEGVVTANEPAIIAGPYKALKTLIGVDLALSLSTGTKFLGVYPTSQSCVAFYSGESGSETLRDTFRMVAEARGINLADVGERDLRLSWTLPDATDAAKMNAFEQVAGCSDVVIVDPLGKCLGSGGDVMNLAAMGELLVRLTDAAHQNLICLHHTVKEIRPGRVLDLHDMAFAGVAEHFRQWFLVNRLTPFRHDATALYNQLVVRYGGSARHAGTLVLDTKEEKNVAAGRPFRLSLAVRTWDQYEADRAAMKAEAERLRQERDQHSRVEQQDRRRRETVERNAEALLSLIPEGESITLAEAKQETGFNGMTAAAAVAHLEAAGLLRVEAEGRGKRLTRIVPTVVADGSKVGSGQKPARVSKRRRKRAAVSRSTGQ